MNTTQIIILTLLGTAATVTLGSLLWRMANLDDDLWIEPTILAVLALFAYLVGKS